MEALHLPHPTIREATLSVGNWGMESPLRISPLQGIYGYRHGEELLLENGEVPVPPPERMTTGIKHGMFQVAKSIKDFPEKDVLKNVFVFPDNSRQRPFFCRGMRTFTNSIRPGRRGSRHYLVINHWKLHVMLRWDTDVLTDVEVFNLLARAGICEGLGCMRVGRGYNSGAYQIRGAVRIKKWDV